MERSPTDFNISDLPTRCTAIPYKIRRAMDFRFDSGLLRTAHLGLEAGAYRYSDQDILVRGFLNGGTSVRRHRIPSDFPPALNRPNYFTDSGDLDISGRLGDNPLARHIAAPPNGGIPGLSLSRIANIEKISSAPFAPTDEEIKIPTPTQISGLRELLVAAVWIMPILRRIWGNFSPCRSHPYADLFTYYSYRDSARVAVLRHELIAGYTGGISINGALLDLRFGSICGIGADRDGDEADIRSAVRLSGRRHLRMSDVVADLRRFRAPP